MNPEPGTRSTPFLLGLSALIMGTCLVIGIALIMDSGGGGFFSGLGKALGLLLIAAGNFASWVLNLICWIRSRQRWLGILTAVQSLPAIIFAGSLGLLAINEMVDNKATEQRVAVYDAIKSDDMAALQQALTNCRTRCQESLSPARNLLIASRHGAHEAARHFIDNGARPYRRGSGSLEFNDANDSLYTCEGRYLSLLNAVDLAIANEDRVMLELLWPVSDAWARSKAARTAAELDRLDMLKLIFDGQDDLLPAAASGAAIEVGQWLLDTRPALLTPDDIQQALTKLLFFMSNIHTPRSVEFGQLLLQHGADIHSARMNDVPALERAIQMHSKTMTLQLLELGADPANLNDDMTARLDALLKEPDRLRTYGRHRTDCIAAP